MNIYFVIAILFFIGYLCKYPLTNLLSKKNTDIRKSIVDMSLASVFEQIGIYAFFAAKTYLVVVLLLILIRVSGLGMSADLFEQIQQRIASFSKGLKDYSEGLGSAILSVAILTTLILLYKKNKKAYIKKVDQQYSELASQHNEGSLKEIPPTKEMNEIVIRMNEIYNWANSQIINAHGNNDIKNSNIQKAEEAIATLNQYYVRLDLERRISLQKAEEEKKTLSGILMSFITSKGFFNTAGKIKGMFGNALSVIALISLLVVQLGHTAYAASSDMGYDIMKKRIAEAQISLGEEGVKNNVLTEAEERILDEMAADFELAVGSNAFWESDNTDDHYQNRINAYQYQSLLVREIILKHFKSTIGERANSKDFDSYTSISDDQFNETGGYRQVVIRKNLKELSEKPTLSELGKNYREILKEKVAKPNPEQWRKLKAKFSAYKQTFSEPISFSHVTGKLWSNVTGDVSGNLARFGDNELGKAANDIVEEIGKDHLKMIHDNIIYKHLNKICSSTPYADAWNDIKNMSSTGIFPNEELAEIVKAKLPMFENGKIKTMIENFNPGLKHNGKSIDLAAIEDIKAKSNGKLSLKEALQTFDDYFPAQNREFVKTEFETRPFASKNDAMRTRASIAENSRVSNNLDNLASQSGEKFKANRARSVRGLRGFSRIGGVLIGELPDFNRSASTNCNIKSFKWETNNTNGVTFILTDAKGNKVKYGPYAKDIVLSALVYAADGRPTTVTMVNASPLVSLKILLHPALVNSQLGLDAIELDRWVDSYQSTEIKNERNYVNLCQDLYTLAHYYRNGLSADKRLANIQKYPVKIINHRLEKNFTLLKGRTLTKKSCPFYSKSEFYEPELLEVIKSSMDTKPQSMKHLNKLIISKIKERWEGKVHVTQEGYIQVGLETLPIIPSNYQIWSGVREVKYNVASPLTITPAMGRSSINYPFNFIVQTSFTSPTLAQSVSTSPEEYMDESPWQFPNLEKRDLVNISVRKVSDIGKKAKMKEVYSRMSQFTELQRLFRLAFEGYLGTEFPLNRFVTLVKEFDTSVPYVGTPEWNSNEAHQAYIKSNKDYKALAHAFKAY